MRLTPDQTKARIEWLSKYRAPAEVGSVSEKIRVSLGRQDFYSYNGHQQERDAFNAARFGQLLSSKAIKLQRPPYADFSVIHSDDRTESIEIVSADRKGRRSALETFIGVTELHPDFYKTEAAQSALEAAAANKIDKLYADSSVSLLIYLNGFWVLEDHHRPCIINGTKVAHHKFTEIYVHDTYGISRAWKNGRPAYRRWWTSAHKSKSQEFENSVFDGIFT